MCYNIHMNRLDIFNPFCAPVYYAPSVGSTMDEAQSLARAGAPGGTVVCADYQKAGRGRGVGRAWEARAGQSLLFTILLRFPGSWEIPQALTLRAGLAVALAIEDFSLALAGRARIKWPNDVMLPTPRGMRKAAGILAEADEYCVRLGIGVNVSQAGFPAELEGKATSVALASDEAVESARRFELLGKILARLCAELKPDGATAWRERAEERLHMRDEVGLFAEGAIGSSPPFAAVIAGIGLDGELLIVPEGAIEVRAFVTGEQMMGYAHRDRGKSGGDLGCVMRAAQQDVQGRVLLGGVPAQGVRERRGDTA